MKHLLIVDDSELVCDMLRMVCEANGDEVTTCTSFSDIIGCLDGKTPDWILSDLQLPDTDLTSPVDAYRGLGLDAPVILISGRPQAELDKLAEEVGAYAALSKDLGIPGIALRLAQILRQDQV
jgi:CheY-like chemotaxis protein